MPHSCLYPNELSMHFLDFVFRLVMRPFPQILFTSFAAESS